MVLGENRTIMAFLYRPLSKYIHWVDKNMYLQNVPH
jgi:hypothetical protein